MTLVHPRDDGRVAANDTVDVCTKAQTRAATESTAVNHKALLQLPNTSNQHAEVPNAWKGLRARRAAANHGETHGQGDDCGVGTTDWHVPL